MTKKTTRKRQLQNRLDTQLAAYTALAAGGLAAASSANAAVVTNTSSFTVEFGKPPVLWDIDGDTNNDFRIRYSGVPALYVLRSNASNAWVQKNTSAANNLVELPHSFTVGATLPGGYAFQTSATAFFTVGSAPVGGLGLGTQNIGFRFNSGGAGFKYGWASITISPKSLTVHEWTYENTVGAPIHIVPEPNSLAYLIAGYAGLVEMRRRRKARADIRTAELV